MILRRHKGKLMATAAVVSILVFGLWSINSSPTPVRLAFLYTTNNPRSGMMGVFQLVNELDETVSSGVGRFKPVTENGLRLRRGEWAGILSDLNGVKYVTRRTTNVFEVSLPTNGGPYKLILFCTPDSKMTPEYYRSARVRIARFLIPWVQPSAATQGQWYGSIFVESQSFEITR